jgi:hypothetical protein
LRDDEAILYFLVLTKTRLIVRLRRTRNDSFLTYYEFIKYRGGKIPEDWPMSRARKQI